MKKKIVLDVWVPDLTFPGWMDRWREQGRDFERAHPDYEVNIEGKDFWTFPLQVAQAAASGQRPAVAEYYFYMGQAARDLVGPDGEPVFTSLERAIGGRTEILGEPVVIDDLLPAFREYYSLDGDLTSMPSGGTTSLLFANKGMLRAAGVTELPQTWAEVDEVCERIAGLRGDRPAFPITWSNHGTFFQQALATQGGLLVDNDNGRSGRATTAYLASEEMLAWVEWWRRLHARGHCLYTGKIPDWAGTFRAFAERDVAIRLTSSNDVNYMVQAAHKNGFDVEVGVFPYNGEVPYVGNAVAGTSLWLANGLDADTQDGALALIQFLHNPRNAADRHKFSSFIPITHASYRLLEDEGWFDQHPYHRLGYEHVSRYPSRALPGGGPVPVSRGALFGDFAGNQDVMTRAMDDVLTRGADPLARFTAATAEAQKLLDEYNAYAIGTGFRNPATSPGHSLAVESFSTASAGRDYSAADLEKVVQLKLNR
ncbi:extracellular solute-binding protein [Nonomuraea sp. NPDC023979]|uniref:extracellular solute-binding protein n=1 Tax=Nonomuraea sp. NPDC023979 TaxID=3154796 RepID=UPI0033E879BB